MSAWEGGSVRGAGVRAQPGLLERHSLRGAIRHTRADRSARRAITASVVARSQRSGGAALACYSYGVSGRPALARALLDRLQQVDPLTSVNLIMSGMSDVRRNYPEALTWTQRASHRSSEPDAADDARHDAGGNGQRDEAALLDGVGRDPSPWHGAVARPWPAPCAVSTTSCSAS